MIRKEYNDLVSSKAPKSPILKNCALAFLIGGAICTVGHGLKDLFLYLGFGDKDASSLVCVTLIFLSVLATGLGIFDNLAKYAGAGTFVPITGFANAVSSCAIDNKSEGYVLGVGAKMFIIAGPVIVYGILSGALYGVIYYFSGVVL